MLRLQLQQQVLITQDRQIFTFSGTPPGRNQLKRTQNPSAGAGRFLGQWGFPNTGKQRQTRGWDEGGGCCHLLLPPWSHKNGVGSLVWWSLGVPRKADPLSSEMRLFLSVYSLSVRLLPPLRLALLMYPDFPVSLPLPFNTFHLCPMPSGSCFLAKKSRRCQWLIMPPFLLLINLVKNQYLKIFF